MVDRQVRRRIGFGLLFLLLAGGVAEIGAGAERLALGGEHRGADLDVVVEFFQRVGDLVDQRDVEEVQRRFADFDQADVAVLLDADISVFGHVLSPMDRKYCNGEGRLPLPRGEGWGEGVGSIERP